MKRWVHRAIDPINRVEVGAVLVELSGLAAVVRFAMTMLRRRHH